MATAQTCRNFGWLWLRSVCWGIGITLLVIEFSVGINYLLAGLREVQPGLFAWWPAFSMMAWQLVDKMTWHAASLDGAARMMPLSAVPFAFIAAAITFGRRVN
jgi:hypothetical protein